MKRNFIVGLLVALMLVFLAPTGANAHPGHGTVKNSATTHCVLVKGSIGDKFVCPGQTYAGVAHTADAAAIYIGSSCWQIRVQVYANGVYQYTTWYRGPKYVFVENYHYFNVTAVQPLC